VVTAAGDVTVYDVDAGKRLWSKEKQVGQEQTLPRGRSTLAVAFSPDATHFVVGGQRVRPTVFEAVTGAALPQLEDVAYADAYIAPACLSRNGRLVVLHGQHWVASRTTVGGFGKQREQNSWSTGPHFLGVWDTATGKLLKQWNQMPSIVAFHPSRPVLAIAEANGEAKTRVGLWDFAEAEKK
jgi:hypothetical protein